MESIDEPHRPWAQGIGLLLLGLAVSAFANGLALSGDTGPVLRTVGTAGYLLGLVVAGAGIHRLLWFGRTGLTFGRLAVTALVTVPAFVGTALLLSVLFSIFQRRFMQ
jgi:hypothetical protein